MRRRFSVMDSPGAMAADVPLALLLRSTTVRPSVPGRATADHAAALPAGLVETRSKGRSQVVPAGPAGSVTSAEPNGRVLVREFVRVTDTGVPVIAATTETGLALSV